ncbi:MAG: hypothetical protein EPN93_08140 [Spirochaetes bacterium]|nr:MAG: hypothetical protein EPN93_08140 [Spirochaetota bacterium]
MNHINISARLIHRGKVAAFSSQLDEPHAAAFVVKEGGYWCSQKGSAITREYFSIDYGSPLPLNTVEVHAAPSGPESFPADFRVEASLDGAEWRIVHTERKYEMGDSGVCVLDIPFTVARFMKFVALKTRKVQTRFFAEVGAFAAGIAGVREISASGASSYMHGAEKLLDRQKGSMWESDLKSAPANEFVYLDLGRVLPVSRLALWSTDMVPNGFPEHFYFEYSTDKNVWSPLFEEKGFLAEPSTRYSWDVPLAQARYVRVEMNTVPLEGKVHGVRLAGLEVFSAPISLDHTHHAGEMTPHASVFQHGVVRMAKDGEDLMGAAVQASDRRLKEATTIFKGIMQFAEDGEDAPGLATQASDRRLKPATEAKYGIVRLAFDRESKQGAVVQGNDTRLQEATESSFGIVKLCPDGIYSDLSVVRGSDKRLFRATAENFGIVRLASDGESAAECVVQGSDRRLRDASTIAKGIVELAEDGEDAPGIAVQGSDRRLRDASTIAKGIVELAEDGEDAPGVAVQGNDRRLRDASTITKGIVELAEDGEDRPGVVVQGSDRRLKDAAEGAKGIMRFARDGEAVSLAAVQGNDRRLRDASTTAKGIVELAEDGQDAPGVAVQGNDRRLKEATTVSKGVVELAEDGEDAAGVVVQGSDRRLRDATTVAKGIVELADNGEDRPGVVVQGNDRRLRDATAAAKGIVELAEDGEDAPNVAVQGSDRRLKDASTVAKGIVELAEDGEDAPHVVVQGSDRRLKPASTGARGIVELADDGEDAPGLAVQGSDRRLRYANESQPGIVRFAEPGESRKGFAVQADDPRLADAREPAAHTHDYAPRVHEFSAHAGTIAVSGARSERYTGVVPPPDGAAVIYAKNESPAAGAVGIAGVADGTYEHAEHSCGVLGHGRFTGVRGQSAGSTDPGPRGCGVLGVSRFGAGGVFASEHGYSLVVDGFGKIEEYDDSLNLVGNGEALKVNGTSDFTGTVTLARVSAEGVPPNIAEMFEVDGADHISYGDVLVASERGGGVLARSDSEYSRAVIGVVSGNPALVLNASGDKRLYPVALAGRAMCKIDARGRQVRPGDLIVTSATPGCGMAGTVDSFEKIGTVLGKALDGLEDGIGVIPIFVTGR